MNPQGQAPTTLFEFPLNERFRTYLRLESLYARWQSLLLDCAAQSHHTALLTLFELFEYAFRYDVKGDLLTDLNRCKQTLERFRDSPGLSEEKLKQSLFRIEDAQRQVEKSPKFGSNLSDNEWLFNVKTRMVLAGGVCSFDVPFYYQWLQYTPDSRVQDLESWITPMLPMFDALKLLMMMARETCKQMQCVSTDKAYQQPLNGQKFDLMQVQYSSLSAYIPDISANKHVIWLRFALPTYRGQPSRPNADLGVNEIPFDLKLCGLF